MAAIQEELIRVKMREAESALSLKDMRQRLAEVEQHWAVRILFCKNFNLPKNKLQTHQMKTDDFLLCKES